MHRLQTVANIGQRAADDHAHRVIEVRPPHLVFDVDRESDSLLSPGGNRHPAAGTVLIWPMKLLGELLKMLTARLLSKRYSYLEQ